MAVEVGLITDIHSAQDLGPEYKVTPEVNGSGGDHALIRSSHVNPGNPDELAVETDVLLRYTEPPQTVETVLYIRAKTRVITGLDQKTGGRRLLFPPDLVLKDLGEHGSPLATNINSNLTAGSPGRVRAATFVPAGR
ncbi:MAG: hypothetical protein KGJ07_01490 [Patescibacteria group bacterium]|nr:hypothetical protein [Patescibacteria group bacterium]MDE2589304.1 hypothetical protein [Patescibacteria group bacterium]